MLIWKKRTTLMHNLKLQKLTRFLFYIMLATLFANFAVNLMIKYVFGIY